MARQRVQDGPFDAFADTTVEEVAGGNVVDVIGICCDES